MDQIILCTNHVPQVTTINNSFITKYMLSANGSYVKVYLYLSMCIQSGDTNLSISSLADKMENTEKDILRAILYWEKCGLFLVNRSAKTITGIQLINPDTLDSDQSSPAPVAVTNEPLAEVDTEPVVSSQEADAFVYHQTDSPLESSSAENTSDQTQDTRQKDLAWASNIIETFLQRPLSSGEVELITYLFDTLHFSKELILHLYDYCCSLGKTNVRYVEKVALSWAEHKVTTPTQAQELCNNYSTTQSAICKKLALNRPLADIEKNYVDIWQNQWAMDLSVILAACDRTMLSIQKPDFKYMEGILKNWHQNNIHTLQDLQVYDKNYNKNKVKASKKPSASHTTGKTTAGRNQFQTFQQRNTSAQEISELERKLLHQ